MILSDAIEILKIEQGISELEISNGNGNKHDEDFIDAVNTVLYFIDRYVYY